MKMLSIFAYIVIQFACNSKVDIDHNYMDIALITDETDLHALKPEAQSILTLFNIANHKNEGFTFRYTVISDKILVPVKSLNLPNASVTSKRMKRNVPLFREKMILQFQDSLRKIVQAGNKEIDSSILLNSECFVIISRELSVLAQSTSKRKVLLNFSNLYENSELLSVYNNETKEILNKHPEKIETLLDETNLLPAKLDGIEVIFYYLPLDSADDKRYNAIASIYKKLLEKRGALVKVQANI